MSNCASMVGVPINYLSRSISETTDTLEGYKTLIVMAPDIMERNMLIQMYNEDLYILSSLSSVYISITGNRPFFSPIVKKPFINYLDGIETVLLADLQVAGLLKTLFLSTEIRNLANLFVHSFSLKAVQATNLNYILFTNKHKYSMEVPNE